MPIDWLKMLNQIYIYIWAFKFINCKLNLRWTLVLWKLSAQLWLDKTLADTSNQVELPLAETLPQLPLLIMRPPPLRLRLSKLPKKKRIWIWEDFSTDIFGYLSQYFYKFFFIILCILIRDFITWAIYNFYKF